MLYAEKKRKIFWSFLGVKTNSLTTLGTWMFENWQ